MQEFLWKKFNHEIEARIESLFAERSIDGMKFRTIEDELQKKGSF